MTSNNQHSLFSIFLKIKHTKDARVQVKECTNKDNSLWTWLHENSSFHNPWCNICKGEQNVQQKLARVFACMSWQAYEIYTYQNIKIQSGKSNEPQKNFQVFSIFLFFVLLSLRLLFFFSFFSIRYESNIYLDPTPSLPLLANYYNLKLS